MFFTMSCQSVCHYYIKRFSSHISGYRKKKIRVVYYHITNSNKLNQSKTFELTSSHSKFNPIFRAIILHTRITIKKKSHRQLHKTEISFSHHTQTIVGKKEWKKYF